ncbi:hypothetical protein [Sphingomonas quercus]|nr:hypothetical protein [Sphingomonas quercus]
MKVASAVGGDTGRHSHRLIPDGIGHDPPHNAPKAFADAAARVAAGG